MRTPLMCYASFLVDGNRESHFFGLVFYGSLIGVDCKCGHPERGTSPIASTESGMSSLRGCDGRTAVVRGVSSDEQDGDYSDGALM